MADTESVEPDYDDLPEVRVTMNQVVAYNVNYFRLRRGLTQEELGQRLEAITGRPWSKATMSAVERSWDGNRIRQFDADDLVALSRALEFPVPALLLPPDDDGVRARYRFTCAGGPVRLPGRVHVDQDGSAEELLDHLFVSDAENSSYPEDAAYVERLETAFGFYYGTTPDAAVVSYSRDRGDFIDDYEMRAQAAAELRNQAQVLRGLLGSIERETRRLEDENHDRGESGRDEGPGPGASSKS